MQGADIGTELAQSMAAVDTVLLARGMVRQKRSRPLRAQLQLHCPKVAVVFENSGMPGGGSSWGTAALGPRLMVAAKELRCTVLAGSHESEQLQSGAGPLTVQVVLLAVPPRPSQWRACSPLLAQHGSAVWRCMEYWCAVV